MLKMKKVCLFLFLFAAIGVAMAQPVDKSKAFDVARTFMSAKIGSKGMNLVDRTAELHAKGVYVFEVADGDGFVVVAGDRRMAPILGYSVSGNCDAMHKSNVRFWLQSYCREAEFVASQYYEAAKGTSRLWSSLLAGDSPYGRGKDVPVSPLLQTTWNQSPLYNIYCPYDSTENTNAVAGCVSISMAQVMKYWEHPVIGEGNHTYHHNVYGDISADFADSAFKWNQMPDELTYYSTTTEVEAVAHLVYHCGVSLDMNYGPFSSSAFNNTNGQMESRSIEQALVENFGYDVGVRCVELDYYGVQKWCSLLDSELYNSRPIIYDGQGSGGHSFVCDGKDADGFYHFNWGWGGSCDGYFAITGLVPNEGSIYQYNQTALIGVRPRQETGDTIFSVNAVASVPGQGRVKGAGEYSRGSRVNLLAEAESGYRFKQWSDGNIYNPRCFLAYGDVSLVAEFEPIWQGKTIVFDNESNRDSWGWGWGSQTSTWGVKYEREWLAGKDSISSVSVNIVSGGNYTMRLCWGSPIRPIREFCNMQFTIPEDFFHDSIRSFWNHIVLDSAIALRHDSMLWVVFECQGAWYPASYSYYSGSWNASYSLLEGESNWQNQTNYGYRCHNSWKIRATFKNTGEDVGVGTAEGYKFSVFPNPATESIMIEGVEVKKVWLFDMKGQRVELPVSNNRVSLTGISKGTYIVQVQNDDGLFSTKIVKE